MGIALIVLGLFLWFALAFNGGVGEPFVNYSFFASGLFMVVSGLLQIVASNWWAARIFCVAALVGYLPMLWQRFNFSFGPDWIGFGIDILIIAFMLIVISTKPQRIGGHNT